MRTHLLARYFEAGYINARAGEAEVKIVEGPRGSLIGFRKTKQQYQIRVPIQEGQQYRYRSLVIEGASGRNMDVLATYYPMTEGDLVNFTALKEARQRAKSLYAARGYLDMEAVPRLSQDRTKHTVDVTVKITEGTRYFLERLNFEGNRSTRDKVMRREFFIEEKDEFNQLRLNASLTRLNQLGFFEPLSDSDFDVVKHPSLGEADVIVRVREKDQQRIDFSGGLNGTSGTFIGINYSNNNFRGLGHRVETAATAGTQTSNYFVRYTDPYFQDSRASLGLSVFHQRFAFDTIQTALNTGSSEDNIRLYTQVQSGFELSGAYPVLPWTRAGVSYSLSTIQINNIHPLIEDQALDQLLGFVPGGSPQEARKGILRSELRPSLNYNTKNALFGATDGSRIFAQIPIIGGPFGGSFNLLRPRVEYQTFFEDHVFGDGRSTLAFRAQVEHVLPFGSLSDGSPQPIPFFERLYSGGDTSLRGFDVRSVGPLAITRSARVDGVGNPLINPSTGLPLVIETVVGIGGDTTVTLTGEYRIPIAGPLALNAFADLGTATILHNSAEQLSLFGPDTGVELIAGTNNVWRLSTGVEVQFRLPLINQPFRFILAYNPLALDTDVVVNGRRRQIAEDRTKFNFTLGYSF